jgi:SOS-response transcriptional repressor LexA
MSKFKVFSNPGEVRAWEKSHDGYRVEHRVEVAGEFPVVVDEDSCIEEYREDGDWISVRVHVAYSVPELLEFLKDSE